MGGGSSSAPDALVGLDSDDVALALTLRTGLGRTGFVPNVFLALAQAGLVFAVRHGAVKIC